jgi:hypothetical protein
VRFVWFEDPFGDRLLAAEYDLREVTEVAGIAQSYRGGWRVSVALHHLPDSRLPFVLDLLQDVVDVDGGVMWEVEDSVVLLIPETVRGPSEPAPGGEGGDPSGDRSPLVPVRPFAAGAIELPLPDEG